MTTERGRIEGARCVICKRSLDWDIKGDGWRGGCNAEPVAIGQCCESCDAMIVLPARLKLAQREINELQREYDKRVPRAINSEMTYRRDQNGR